MHKQKLFAVAILLCATVVLGSCQGGDTDRTRNADDWRRYRKALLLTGERPEIRAVRLIHHDNARMNLYRQRISDAWLTRSRRVPQPYADGPARLSRFYCFSSNSVPYQLC